MISTASVATCPPVAPREKRSLFFDATPLLFDPIALRARAEQDGYLFFKHFLPVEPLRELRRQMLQICADRHWLKKDTDFADGVIDEDAINQVPLEQMRTDIGVSDEAYRATQKLELFHTIPHHPKLLSLYRTLFGREVLPHPRHIARMITCHRDMTPTPPHQDHIHIQGTPRTWTCWFPVGDCPREMGALTALRGSHRHGVVATAPSKGAGGLAAILCPDETDWVEGDFEMGDILTFTSYTIHRALRSQQRERIRLSCDIRFQPADEEIHEGSLNPHGAYKWEELYEGWKNPDVQYYWKKHDLRMGLWDDNMRWQKERICS